MPLVMPLLMACGSVLILNQGVAMVNSTQVEDHYRFMDVQRQFPSCSPFDTYYVARLSQVYSDGRAYTSSGMFIRLSGRLRAVARSGCVIYAHTLVDGTVEPVVVVPERAAAPMVLDGVDLDAQIEMLNAVFPKSEE